MAKWYKVDPALYDLAHQNYVYDNYKYHFIKNNPYIKIQDNGTITDLQDREIIAFRRNPEQDKRLVISPEHMIYFIEVPDPGPKVFSDIKFVVVEHYYGGDYETRGSFDDHIRAIEECERLAYLNPKGHYSVIVEYQSKYNFKI
ncbi:hypothetical protein Abraxas_043 [Acinetobacter phage Abraxas]|uniref:Uncharacterized protein n=1 Tax=Acinetobacter phage Abraxas TaxID=2736222 RepID=A0A6M9Z5S1_9CAUD|nr:hypothetical protein Abraxas_043 [Acinetobacter phage Abraxas]